MKQKVVKIENLNKSLKRAYEKGFLDDSKFDYIRSLRKIRRHPEQDSVSSHYGSDEEFDIRDVIPKRGFMKNRMIDQEDILSSSNSEAPRPTQKKNPRARAPPKPKQPR